MAQKKLTMFYVLDILKEQSDENHILAQKEILSKVYQIYGLELDRKTIADNLSQLEQLGYDIQKTAKGCYLGEREFEPSEISFLIDAVFSSRAIDSKNAQKLALKLSSFLSVSKRKKYNYIYKSDEVSRTDNKQLFFTIDMLNEAIENGKQVEFCYDKKFLDSTKQKTQNEKRYIINPYFLVNSQGKYYLVCNYDKYDDIANYRVEQIKDIKILDSKVKPIKQIKGFENGTNIAKYASENIYMFSDKTIKATLKLASDNMITFVYDWFGKNANIYEKDNEIFADITSNEQALIYWCLQYGENVELISPTTTREKIKEIVDGMEKKYK